MTEEQKTRAAQWAADIPQEWTDNAEALSVAIAAEEAEFEAYYYANILRALAEVIEEVAAEQH